MEKCEDTQMILVLNSYIMSNLPPEPKQDELKPIKNMIDVRRKISENKWLKEQNLSFEMKTFGEVQLGDTLAKNK